jgi:hypothetical protein
MVLAKRIVPVDPAAIGSIVGQRTAGGNGDARPKSRVSPQPDFIPQSFLVDLP